MENVIPTVGVLIINQDKVLLVKHTPGADHLTDTFGIPAGRLEGNEIEIEGAIRELKEETGLVTNKKSLVPLPAIYQAAIKRKNGTKNFSLKVFVCNKYDGEIKKSKESVPEWVLLTEVRKLNLLPSVRKIIRDGLKSIKGSNKVH